MPFTATFGPKVFFKLRTLIMGGDGKPAPAVVVRVHK
jgi:hypothetical protein